MRMMMTMTYLKRTATESAQMSLVMKVCVCVTNNLGLNQCRIYTRENDLLYITCILFVYSTVWCMTVYSMFCSYDCFLCDYFIF